MHSYLCFVAVLLVSAAAAPAGPGPTATIANGVVLGAATAFPSATVNKFLGIPFAKSPPERFSPPEDAQSWSDPLDATAFKPACIQQFNYPDDARNFEMNLFNTPPPAESEDCLYLNVYAPTTPAPDGGWPILFWVFGGGLEFGTGGNPFYDGSTLAANQNVVVVTINYRTNAFGFPNSPELDDDARNLGFLDQRKALAWVASNIHAFGGDPTKVTLFGESAGGYSIKQLLALPPDPLPFRAAIMQSEAIKGKGDGEDAWNKLVEGVGCADAESHLTCVRGVEATKIKDFIEHDNTAFGPTIDGKTAVEDVRDPIQDKTWANVPFIIGTNKNEGRLFVTAAGITPEAGREKVKEFLDGLFPNSHGLVDLILKAYPADLVRDAYRFLSQVVTDYIFDCRAALIAEKATKEGYTVYRYLWSGVFPNTQVFPDAGAFHSSEIPFVFGTVPAGNSTPEELQLSLTMQQAWAGFATHPDEGPGWAKIGSADNIELQEFGSEDGAGTAQTVDLDEGDKYCGVYDIVLLFKGLRR